MRHEHENARRHAYNTLAEVNRHLDKGNIKNPKHHQMLTDMAEKATRTLNNLDARDDARPYSDTNIGYNADMRRRRYDYDDTTDVIKNAMEVINKILPSIDDYDMEMRQGVPGTGPYANPRLRRRGGRKGIGRRSDITDKYDFDDRYDVNDNYDDMDDNYDDVEARRGGRRKRDSRGRFAVNDMDRYDDMRYNDDVRYTADEARRTADEARRTSEEARRMANEAKRIADDTRTIYPGTPIMPQNNNRHDTRNDIRGDMRNDTQTNDRADRPGPDMIR